MKCLPQQSSTGKIQEKFRVVLHDMKNPLTTVLERFQRWREIHQSNVGVQ